MIGLECEVDNVETVSFGIGDCDVENYETRFVLDVGHDFEVDMNWCSGGNLFADSVGNAL